MKQSLTEETERKSRNILTLIRSHEASMDITFDRTNYRSPDIVKAKVTIRNQKLIKLESLVVEIQGYETISFLVNDNRATKTRIFLSKTITLLSDDHSACTLSPGQHAFPVVFNLPQGLPSSFLAFWNSKLNGSIGI